MRFTIRQALLIAFVGIVVLLTSLIVSSSVASESRLVRAVAVPIVDLQSDRAARRIDQVLSPIRQELSESLRLIRRGQLCSRDPDGARRAVIAGFQGLTSVGSMMIGDETGYQLLIMRYDASVTESPLLAGVVDMPPALEGDTRFITREFDRELWGDRSLWQLWNESGTQLEQRWEVDLPGYEPSERPWLREALAKYRSTEPQASPRSLESLLAWTEVYTLFTSKTPGISASVADRDPDGNVVVVAYDLLLSDLNAFTSSQSPTPRGKLFLCDDQERVLALPQGLEAAGEAPKLLRPIAEVGSPVLEGWSRHPWLADNTDQQIFEYEAAGERWWGLRRPFALGEQDRLWIGVALPRDEILSMVGHEPWRIVVIASVALLLVSILASWLSGRIGAPIERLVEESERIGRLELTSERSPTPSRVVELTALGEALHGMRGALSEHMQARDLALAALAESEERFRHTFEQAAVGLAHVSLDGRLQLVNQKLCAILGYSRKELQGKRLSSVTPLEDRSKDIQRIQRVMTGEDQTANWEKRYIHLDGSLLWAEVTTSLQRDADGTPLYFVTVVQDIRERKVLESQLRQSQKLEAVGRLAGGVAHDFNNLLTVITGYSQLIRNSLAVNDPVQKDLAQIEQASGSAAALTNQLLTFARKEVTSPRVIDVFHEVEESRKLIDRLIGDDVVFKTRLEGGPHHAFMDPLQLQQVLVNLAVNARDAMPHGGRLTITVRPTKERSEQAIEVRVADTGQGMTDDVRAHAFEPFFTTKDVGSGTGLGLATCYGIVKQAGGTTLIESAEGRGTTIVIRLPATTNTPDSKTDEPTCGEAVTGNATILLVEDEPQLRLLSSRILRRGGYTVLAAESAVEALLLFDDNPTIDLVVSDVIMPGMSGGDLVKHLWDRRPDQAILLLSGYTRDVLTGKIPNQTPLLSKPFSPSQLLARVRELLDDQLALRSGKSREPRGGSAGDRPHSSSRQDGSA